MLSISQDDFRSGVDVLNLKFLTKLLSFRQILYDRESKSVKNYVGIIKGSTSIITNILLGE